MKLRTIIESQQLKMRTISEGNPSKGVVKQQKKLTDLSKQISKLNADLEKVTNDLLLGRDKYFQAGMDGNVNKSKAQMVIQKQLTQKKKDIMDELEPLKDKFYALGMTSGVGEPDAADAEVDALDQESTAAAAEGEELDMDRNY